MSNSNGGDDQQSLGQNSTIRVGLGLIVASYIAMSSWWAATMNAKLTIVISNQQVANGDVTTLRGKVEALERSAEQFQQFGSPVLRARLEVLEKSFDKLNTMGCPASVEIRKRVEQLDKDLEMHKITDKKSVQ